MTTICIALIVVLSVVIICVFARELMMRASRRYIVRGMVINVLSEGADKDAAIALMMQCNERMLKLLAHLRAKYMVGITDEECAGECASIIASRPKTRAIIEHLLRDFNYEAIHEHRPQHGSQSVAYSLDKGETIMLCLRSIDAPYDMIDINTLMFVILHEAAHIANYSEWGHSMRYWQIFKYILQEAVNTGVYTAVDYARQPQNYCGFNLNHSPLFDARIPTLELN
jgi:hypothetical protein